MAHFLSISPAMWQPTLLISLAVDVGGTRSIVMPIVDMLTPWRRERPMLRRSVSLRLVLLACTLLVPVPAWSQSAADSVAIRSAALDYIEGWYTADAERMERALHPHLAKRFMEATADGGVRLTETTAMELVQQVRAGGGSGTPEQTRRTDVRILDVFQNVASVRVDAHGWIDYMHLAKAGGRWTIVNVLWEIRSAPAGASGAAGTSMRPTANPQPNREAP